MYKFVTAAAASLVGLITIILLFQPLGVDSQIALGASALVLMLLIRLFDAQGYLRFLFFTLGAALIGRYVYWRTTSTLPSPDSLADFIPGVVLYGAEIFCIVLLVLNLFVIARPAQRRAPPRLPDSDKPSVDVFVPSLNESADLLALTLAAAKAMRYPADKLNVYLLDDGGTDAKINSPNYMIAESAAERRKTLQAMCAELGVVYLTREQNVQAKAGNLTNGLMHSAGELIVVFDADHAPTPEFLEETVGYFGTDERLFLVQTPHFFLNPDPIEKNLSTFDRMPSENEMFYGIIQKGLDKWNAAFFCGSAAVLRRSALEEAGGFSGTSITEDCETALDLHSRGWRSLYIDKPMIVGLQPETFATFIGQRSRWCRGMLQILLLKNPLWRPGLTMAQRLCYVSSSMFWLFPIPRVIFTIAPLLYLFFGLQIYNAAEKEFVAYTVMYLLAALTLQSYAYGRFRWPWISEIYEYVQGVYLLPAIVSVIRNPHQPTFNVTAKGVVTKDDHLSRLAWPYFLIFAVLLAGLLVTLVRLETDPDSRGLLVIVGLWNLFNLIIAGVALGAVSERRDPRGSHRIPVRVPAALRVDDTSVPVVIEDISLGGVRIRPLRVTKGLLSPRKTGVLSVAAAGEPEGVSGLRVRVANSSSTGDSVAIGLAFESLNWTDYRLLAQLAYSDLSHLHAARRARHRVRGIVSGGARMGVWAVRHSLRGLYYAVFRRAAARELASAN
jgi:cellulose synthase (UDP-forming)